MYFVGDWMYDNQRCTTPIVDNNLHFYNSQDYSQLVIGESAASCMISQIAASPLLQLSINTQKFNEMFNVQGYTVDTSSLAGHIGLFEAKWGKNKPLLAKINFKDFDVLLGREDADVRMEYTMCMSFSLDERDAREFLYDCIPIDSSFNIRAESEIIHIDIIDHHVNSQRIEVQKKMPIRESIQMTSMEYQSFLEDV